MGRLPLRLRRLGGRGSVRGSPCGEPARLCPPFFLLRGYPSSAKLVLGRPPSSGDSAGPPCSVRSRNIAQLYGRAPPTTIRTA
jgi:hypothetical protein